MDRYIEQLIEEMQLAMDNRPIPEKLWEDVDFDNPAEMEDMAYVEQYINGTTEQLSKILGIDKIQFPPLEKLTSTQAATIYKGMEELLQAFNFHPDFPDNLPLINKYQVLRAQWEMEVMPVSAGISHLEFCDYEPAACPFPLKYCTCKAFEEEEMQEPTVDFDDENTELPF